MISFGVSWKVFPLCEVANHISCISISVTKLKVEKILKGSLDSIPSPSVKIQIMGRKVCLKCKGKTLMGRCQQTFENKKFVDITQQCFAILP